MNDMMLTLTESGLMGSNSGIDWKEGEGEAEGEAEGE